MTRFFLRSGFVALLCAAAGSGRAQEVERGFCDDQAPQNNCPGPNCRCVDDSFEVVFPIAGIISTSIFRYSEFQAGARIDTNVVLDTQSAGVAAFSYGVRNDAAFLGLILDSLTVDGTVLDAFPGAFNEIAAVDGGFIHAAVLSFQEPLELPVRRNVIAKASYSLVADAGLAGTRLQVVADLRRGDALVPINVSVGTLARLPRVLRDGIVRRVEVPQEICTNGADDDGDRLVDLEDPDCQECVCLPDGACPDFAYFFGDRATNQTVDAAGQASFAISSRNTSPLLAFQFGVRTTVNGQTSTYEFSGGLGTDPNRLIEILMTDDQGNSIIPLTPNRLVAEASPIASVDRGRALQALAGGDFLEVNLNPGVGGPGFFVGYVSDLDANVDQIPATPPPQGSECPLNELLVVRLTPGVCPAFAFVFGPRATSETVDARGQASFAVSTRNRSPLLGFQLGVAVRPEDGGSFRYAFSSELGTDANRLIELLMTDDMGNSITPQTLNDLVAGTGNIFAVDRGAAIAPFRDGDFLEVNLNPGVGGPGFFAGYVSDLDANVNQIPATPDANCPVNEVLIVRLEAPGVCPDFAFGFDGSVQPGEVDGRGQADFAISSRNIRPLFGFQLGVRTTPGLQGATFAFTGELGTDANRLIELLMTDDSGNSVVPQTPNTFVADTDVVNAVERGMALQPFAGGDFLEVNLSPRVGGDGFFAGYVSDLDDDANRIPATASDPSCPLNELLRVRLGAAPECPPFALYFGPAATSVTADVRGRPSFVISSRNTSPLLGVQFGVATSPATGGGFGYEFTGDLGTDPNRLVEILMTDNQGNSITPMTPNGLLADTDSVATVARGAALAPLAGGDFLEFNLNPGTGDGFFVGYVSDLDGITGQIPATGDAGCPLNELFVVTFGANRNFFRSDADGNGRLNVTDAVLIIQNILMNLNRRFNCDDMLDADDNGLLQIVDGVALLNYLFVRGMPLPPPFFACGQDPTPDALGCAQANCN
jgi:hypothetical protein